MEYLQIWLKDNRLRKGENMIVNIERQDAKVIIQVEGRLDTMTAPELETAFTNNIMESNVVQVVLDLKKLEYMSSAGIRVVLGADKTIQKKGGNMKLIHVNAEIMEILDITGLVDILDIVRPEDEAD